MNGQNVVKALVGASSLVIIVGVYAISAITMYSLDRGYFSLLSVFLMFAGTLIVVIGLATLSSLVADYIYDIGWNAGYKAAMADEPAKVDNAKN